MDFTWYTLFMYKEELKNIGFSEGESDVYVYLLQHGEKSAGDIIDGTGLKRGNTYNILESLVAKRVIAQSEKNKIAHFSVENPRAILDYIDQKKTDLDNKKTMTEALLPALVSSYQLTTNKPVVSYYEGNEGFAKVINDTLTSKTEILQYSDVEIIERDFKKESDAHLRKRASAHIEKKLIVLDTPFARALYKNLHEDAVSHVRAILPSEKPFDVAMFIYDNKISYLTLVRGSVLGVIIEDSHIYEMHKHLFMSLYEKALPITGV